MTVSNFFYHLPLIYSPFLILTLHSKSIIYGPNSQNRRELVSKIYSLCFYIQVV